MILLKTVFVAAPNRALGLLGVFFCEILVGCVSVDYFSDKGKGSWLQAVIAFNLTGYDGGDFV